MLVAVEHGVAKLGEVPYVGDESAAGVLPAVVNRGSVHQLVVRAQPLVILKAESPFSISSIIN